MLLLKGCRQNRKNIAERLNENFRVQGTPLYIFTLFSAYGPDTNFKLQTFVY